MQRVGKNMRVNRYTLREFMHLLYFTYGLPQEFADLDLEKAYMRPKIVRHRYHTSRV